MVRLGILLTCCLAMCQTIPICRPLKEDESYLLKSSRTIRIGDRRIVENDVYEHKCQEVDDHDVEHIEAKCVEVWKNQQLDAEAIYKDGMYGFFSKVRVGDILLSEDFSFCHRWVNECAGEIWCKIDSYARHLGEFKFSG